MNKVIINFDILHTTMKNWIDCKIGGTDVVTPQIGRPMLRNPKLMKKNLKPNYLSCSISNFLVFGLRTRIRNR
jgi:hypothetical protein